MQYIASLLIFALLLMSPACERDITLELPITERQIVVEGYIEQGSYPYVFLTLSAPYLEVVNSTTLQNMVITNAQVIVSDGKQSDTLKVGFDSSQFPFIKYQGQRIRGEAGKTYYLTVNYQNKTVTAVTTIPQPVAIDSLTFKAEAPYDSLGYVWFHFSDPDTIGNYYRTFTKTLGKDSNYVHPFATLLDDKLVNGTAIQYPIYHGRDSRLIETEEDEDEDENNNQDTNNLSFYFKTGEIVVMKLCGIDYAHYRFWMSIEQQMMSGSNPFSAPTTIKSNIKGGLGIWGGYSITTDTIKIGSKK